jgi:hypothetical protein
MVWRDRNCSSHSALHYFGPEYSTLSMERHEHFWGYSGFRYAISLAGVNIQALFKFRRLVYKVNHYPKLIPGFKTPIFLVVGVVLLS